jgi:hypothetical protein
MSIDDAVRKRGFHQWYERQLIEGHAYLVTGLLSLLMTALALEMIEFRASIATSIVLALVAAISGWLSFTAWKQFVKLLSCAQSLAGQAVCGECRTYGKFDIVEARDSSEALSGRSLVVRCRKCRHQWSMG